MALLERITRSNPWESPSVPLASLANAPGWFMSWANGLPTDSGEHVTPLSALKVITIIACCKVISEGIGQLPIQVIERLDRGKRVAYEHDLSYMLSSEWNSEMTAIVGMEVSLIHALLWGGSFTEIQRDNGNRPIALWPRKPWETKPKRTPTGKLVYETHDTQDGTARVIEAGDMIAVPGLSLDGWVGVDIIQYARQQIGLALALERHAALYFSNGATASGTMEVPGELSDKAYQRMKTSVDQQITGANRFRALILEAGTKWNSISSTNNEAQFLESRKLVRSELASLFRCPLHMIASDESRGVKSNTEQVSQDFLTFTLNPWIAKYQQEFNRKLFPRVGRNANRYEVRYHTHALMAADSAGRMTYYTEGRNSGLFSINDCLEMEGRPLIGPEGDEHMVPLNYIPASQLLVTDAEPDPLTKQGQGEDEDAQTSSWMPRLIRTYSPLFMDAFSRLSHRSKRDSTAIRQCLMPVLEAVSSSIRDLLAQQSRVDISDIEYRKSLNKYLDGVEGRADAIDQSAEIRRALKTIIYAAHRDLAEAKAKKAVEEVNAEDEPQDE
jgi:HK97 family phage portal protein